MRAFKRGRPDARLAVLTPARLEAFWKSIPEVDEVVSFAPEDSLFAIAKKIRRRFEAAILFPNSLRSAAEVWLAGIPRRVGFRGDFRAMLLTQIIDEPKKKKVARPKHQADRYWHIAEQCGAVEPPPLPAQPAPPQTAIVLGVCPGAEYRTRQALARRALPKDDGTRLPKARVFMGNSRNGSGSRPRDRNPARVRRES